MRVRVPLLSVAALGILAMLGSLANAATVSYNFTYPTTKGPSAGTVSVAKFDTQGGTLVLNQVTLNVTGTVNPSINVANLDDATGQAKYNAGSNFTVSAAGNQLVSLTATSPYLTLTLDPGNAAGIGLPSATGTASTTLSSGLGIFEGTGTVGLDVAANPFFSQEWLSGGFLTVQKLAVMAGLTGTVTYSYSPVPEPSVLVGLAGMGLVGLGLTWFRKRRA